jgi:hypothetical protein
MSIQSLFPLSDFEYIQDYTREQIKDAYDVISQKELWGTFRAETISCSGNYRKLARSNIYEHIQDIICGETPTGGLHSGSSMCFVMNVMMTIALHGEPHFRGTFAINQEEPEEVQLPQPPPTEVQAPTEGQAPPEDQVPPPPPTENQQQT